MPFRGDGNEPTCTKIMQSGKSSIVNSFGEMYTIFIFLFTLLETTIHPIRIVPVMEHTK